MVRFRIGNFEIVGKEGFNEPVMVLGFEVRSSIFDEVVQNVGHPLMIVGVFSGYCQDAEDVIEVSDAKARAIHRSCT